MYVGYINLEEGSSKVLEQLSRWVGDGFGVNTGGCMAVEVGDCPCSDGGRSQPMVPGDDPCGSLPTWHILWFYD